MKKDQFKKFEESLYRYDDYREFLKDFFSLQKKLRTELTQKSFAAKAGLASHTFCSYVINGKRNLSTKTIQSFAQTMGLDSTKTNFFANLVLFNQTEQQQKKEFYYDEMQRLRKLTKFKSISGKQSDFYNRSYNAIVRELAVNSNWNGDYEKLANLLYPSITKQQAEASVALMIEIKMLKKSGEEYSFYSENMHDRDIPAFLKKKTRREVFERGIELLDNMSPDRRFAAYTTFMSDRETYDEIENEYREFRKRVNELIVKTKSKDEVFQMTYELFPVSKNVKEKI